LTRDVTDIERNRRGTSVRRIRLHSFDAAVARNVEPAVPQPDVRLSFAAVREWRILLPRYSSCMTVVPQQPSAEALRQLQRARRGGQRRMLERLRPHGFRLTVFKAMMRGLDAVLRPPRTTVVSRI